MGKEPEATRPTTPMQKFAALARKIVQTPKTQVDKREQAWREKRRKQKRSDV